MKLALQIVKFVAYTSGAVCVHIADIVTLTAGVEGLGIVSGIGNVIVVESLLQNSCDLYTR